MFSHDKDTGTVVCLSDYGRIKRGAVVPKANELYADVEDWLAEGNELAPFDGYPDTRSLDEAKAAKLSEINEAYQEQMADTLNKYPNAETLTFDKQEREARVYQEWLESGGQGTAPSTPLIANLAEGRQMSKEDLVPRIIAKADAFTAESGHATGKRQYLEDRINNAATIEELEAISW